MPPSNLNQIMKGFGICFQENVCRLISLLSINMSTGYFGMVLWHLGLSHELLWHVARRGLVCQKQVSRTGASNYIPQILWDVITCPCPWYLRLARKSLYIQLTGWEPEHGTARRWKQRVPWSSWWYSWWVPLGEPHKKTDIVSHYSDVKWASSS